MGPWVAILRALILREKRELPETWPAEERLLELDLDPSKSQELTHRFDLDPGTLWQAAV